MRGIKLQREAAGSKLKSQTTFMIHTTSNIRISLHNLVRRIDEDISAAARNTDIWPPEER